MLRNLGTSGVGVTLALHHCVGLLGGGGWGVEQPKLASRGGKYHRICPSNWVENTLTLATGWGGSPCTYPTGWREDQFSLAPFGGGIPLNQVGGSP